MIKEDRRGENGRRKEGVNERIIQQQKKRS